MNPLQVAVYALVLSGGSEPFTCTGQGNWVHCSNNMWARYNTVGEITFQDGTAARRLTDGTLVFTNGITTTWGSAGWVNFSNGHEVRRMSDGSFRFNGGMECADGPEDGAGRPTATCAPRQ